MEVKQCDFCRMPFQTYGSKICKDCLAQLDEDFLKIKDYLYEHDSAGIDEVADETGVPRKSIMFLLKEERLTVGNDGDDGGGLLKCETCKKPIRTGRICKSCKNEVLAAIETVAPVKKPKPAAEEPEEVSIKGAAKLQVR